MKKTCDACTRTEILPGSETAYPYKIDRDNYEWTRHGWHRVDRTDCWLCPPCTRSILVFAAGISLLLERFFLAKERR